MQMATIWWNEQFTVHQQSIYSTVMWNEKWMDSSVFSQSLFLEKEQEKGLHRNWVSQYSEQTAPFS